MKRYFYIAMFIFLAISMHGSVIAATYDATGLWTYETTDNRASTGCTPDSNEDGCCYGITQKGDWVSIYVKGFTRHRHRDRWCLRYSSLQHPTLTGEGTTTVNVNFHTHFKQPFGSGTISVGSGQMDPWGDSCNAAMAR